MSDSRYPVTARSRVERLPKRGSYDREAIYPILDEALVCHVGFATDGQPCVIPCFYARDGDRLLLHGAVASRLMQTLGSGAPSCITVTLLDGLVLARSAFRHSMNYRSVVCFGRAQPIIDDLAKKQALALLVDKVVAGRNADVRPPNASELKATTVVAFTIEEASAKVRRGPPVDDPRDLELPVWAGEVPLAIQWGDVVPAPELAAETPLPDYLRSL
ncbi:MAG: pyridoxamine 5'-phosphate oxidase family protein [Proteobacteria bacterium]|nr:MAG: pyridoxamine 5'-phosphate oxidase family protein [Pseudomonadota bacterium]